MRCNKLYLDDVSEVQGNLFATIVRHKYNLIDFIKYYMQSEYRQQVDKGSAWYCTQSDDIILDRLREHENFKGTTTNKYQDEVMAQWLGEFYSYAQWYLDKNSSEVVKIIQPERMIAHYSVLHDMDMQEVVEKICKR
jgi:hypothetical protein